MYVTVTWVSHLVKCRFSTPVINVWVGEALSWSRKGVFLHPPIFPTFWLSNLSSREAIQGTYVTITRVSHLVKHRFSTPVINALYEVDESLASYEVDELLASYEVDESLALYEVDESLALYEVDESLALYEVDESRII